MGRLIDRAEALEICEKEYQERLRMSDYCGDTVAWNIGNAIKALPSVQPEVRRGKWIKKHNDIIYWWECSECGNRENDESRLSRFCPDCGADMRENVD